MHHSVWTEFPISVFSHEKNDMRGYTKVKPSIYLHGNYKRYIKQNEIIRSHVFQILKTTLPHSRYHLLCVSINDKKSAFLQGVSK